MKNIGVIGGGPAGMLAAGIAAEKGYNVTLFEKNEKLGKKLFITGKGRCNLTNAVDPEGLIANTVGNPYFMYSGFYSFSSQDTMDFFQNKLNVPLKIERGNRVFPKSDKSSDIVRSLGKYVKSSGVKIMLNTTVNRLLCENNVIKGLVANNKEYKFNSIIIATGGLSYPMTGSTGDGYKFAKSLGHKIEVCRPSLVPLKVEEKWVSNLMGLSLKNVELTVSIKGKKIYSDFGEMLFTHFGVSGPLVLSASRYVNDKLDEKPKISIDLKPALDNKELDNRILRDFQKYANKDFRNALGDLLPQKLIPVVIMLSEIDEFKKVNSITKEERGRLLSVIKSLKLTVVDTTGYNEAVVTSGGVSTDEIDPSTMESKIIKGLFFAGEVIDCDAFTGGFNLQIAFSTGYLAGSNC